MTHIIYNKKNSDKLNNILNYKEEDIEEEEYFNPYEEYELKEEEFANKLYEETQPFIIDIDEQPNITKKQNIHEEKYCLTIDEMTEFENDYKKINTKMITQYISFNIYTLLERIYQKNINYEKKRDVICNKIKLSISELKVQTNIFQNINIVAIYEKLKGNILKSTNQLECIQKEKKLCRESYTFITLFMNKLIKYMQDNNYNNCHLNGAEIILIE